MANTPSEPKFFQADRIVEVKYLPQAGDYFQRFKMELGRTTSKKTGHPVFTNFQCWCHPPTLSNPDFKIKIQLSNKKGGSVFTQVYVSEFDELLSLLQAWRIKYDPEFLKGQSDSIELRKRSYLHNSMTNILEDLRLPSSIVDEAIQDRLSRLDEELDNYQRPTTDYSWHANEFLKLLHTWRNTDSDSIKRHIESEMRQALPPSREDINIVRELIINGLHPDEIFKDILDSHFTNALQYEEDTLTNTNTEVIDNEESKHYDNENVKPHTISVDEYKSNEDEEEEEE